MRKSDEPALRGQARRGLSRWLDRPPGRHIHDRAVVRARHIAKKVAVVGRFTSCRIIPL